MNEIMESIKLILNSNVVPWTAFIIMFPYILKAILLFFLCIFMLVFIFKFRSSLKNFILDFMSECNSNSRSLRKEQYEIKDSINELERLYARKLISAAETINIIENIKPRLNEFQQLLDKHNFIIYSLQEEIKEFKKQYPLKTREVNYGEDKM